MRALCGLAALLLALGASAEAPTPEMPPRPGAALAKLPPCPHGPETWTPVGGLQEALVAGRFEEVERVLERAHTDFEQDPRCEQRMLRPFLAGFWGSVDDHQKNFERWATARPDAWTARTLRGVFWVQEAYRRRGIGRSSEIDEAEHRGMVEAIGFALPDLERAIELHPGAVVAYGALLDAHRLFGQTGDAMAVWKRARAAAPLSVHVRERAIEAFQPWWGGSPALVQEVAADARSLEPKNPYLIRMRGYRPATEAGMLANQGPETPREFGQIAALYTRALQYGELGSGWHLSRVANYYRGGSFELALRDAGYALEADPGLYWFHDWRIRALLALSRYDDAVAAAREAQTHFPAHHQMIWWEGQALYQLRRWEEAATAYRRAIDCCAAPEDDRMTMLVLLSDSLRRIPRLSEAEAAAREALALRAEDADSWRALGRALRAQGKREDAEAAFQHAPDPDAAPPADAH